MNSTEPVLDGGGVQKHFAVRRGVVFQRSIGSVRAVDDVSFSVGRGETLSLVGESGCCKSTTGRLILRLMEPTAGTIPFNGEDIASLDKADMRRMRPHMQIIFQDPYASLNPRMTVGETLAEPLEVHRIVKGAKAAACVRELLDVVRLLSDHAQRHPHQSSGGQRQRIGIATGLAAQPDLIVCDEPVSALDVSIQAQVVNLLQDLRERFALSYLFSALDIADVGHEVSCHFHSSLPPFETEAAGGLVESHFSKRLAACETALERRRHEAPLNAAPRKAPAG